MIQQHEKPIHWAEAFGLSALVHVGLAYLILNTVVDLDAVFERSPDASPELQITSLAIDSGSVTSTDTGLGGPAIAAPETLSPIDGTGDAVDPITSDAPAIVAENTAAPSQPEELATVQPERLTPITPAPTAVAPQAVSPLRPETQTLAPVVAAPVAPAIDTAPTTTPAPAAPVRPDPIPEPSAPAPAPAPTPSQPAEPDALAADLINRIRSAVGDTCLIAIPQQTADGDITLTIYTADETVVGPYADEILADFTPRPVQDTVLIDPRQCAALDYVRQSAAYPTSPLTLGLDTARIASGELLTGRIAGTGGRNITLMVVDDNGVTQDLGQYLSVAVNTARFAAPLRRSGVARDTRQLLIAIGTNARPSTATVQNGQVADDYFTALAQEIGANAPIALIPFDVR